MGLFHQNKPHYRQQTIIAGKGIKPHGGMPKPQSKLKQGIGHIDKQGTIQGDLHPQVGVGQIAAQIFIIMFQILGPADDLRRSDT